MATYNYGVNSAPSANKRHLAVLNPAGSGKTMTLFRVKAAGAPAVAVAGLVVPLTVLRITTVTGGSNVSQQKAVSTDPDSGMTAVTGATAATEVPGFFGCGIVSVEETSSANESIVYDSDVDGSVPMTFAPGEGFLVKQGAMTTAVGAINIVARIDV